MTHDKPRDWDGKPAAEIDQIKQCPQLSNRFTTSSSFPRSSITLTAICWSRRVAVAGAAWGEATETEINSTDRGIAKPLLPRPPRRPFGCKRADIRLAL